LCKLILSSANRKTKKTRTTNREQQHCNFLSIDDDKDNCSQALKDIEFSPSTLQLDIEKLWASSAAAVKKTSRHGFL
jgi:hypothetical protein